jgi:hypothetical protein
MGRRNVPERRAGRRLPVPYAIAISHVEWRPAFRVIRSIFPPIDLFDDIADPADWPLLISAEQKTNPRLMESLGNLDLVPPERRVGGPGSTYLMSPFTHVSPDRASRFTNGSFGILYAGNSFEVALLETVHHHGRFMERTSEPAGWTSQFREIVMEVEGDLHDLRGEEAALAAVLRDSDYGESQQLGLALKAAGSEGLVWNSLRHKSGECVGLFFPDLGANAVQGRHLDYHWNGERVDLYRNASSGEVFRIV